MQPRNSLYFVFSLIFSLSLCEDIQTTESVATIKTEEVSDQPVEKEVANGNSDQTVQDQIEAGQKSSPELKTNDDSNGKVNNEANKEKPVSQLDDKVLDQPVEKEIANVSPDFTVRNENEADETISPKVKRNDNSNGKVNDESNIGIAVSQSDDKKQSKQKESADQNTTKNIVEKSNDNVVETKTETTVSKYTIDQKTNIAAQEHSTALNVRTNDNNNTVKEKNEKNDGVHSFDALKKSLVESIMNKTSALVIILARKDLYSSEKEKSRVLTLIKAKILKRVSVDSDRYKLWTDIITKGVDATFAKLRQIKRYGRKKYRKHSRRENDKEFEPNKNTLISKPSQPLGCDILIQIACTKIKSLNLLRCDSGNNSVTMEKLCDGTYDCTDGSDEINCPDKATQKLKETEDMIEETGSSQFMSCFNYDDSYLGRKKLYSVKKVVANQVALIAQRVDAPLVKTSLGGQTKDRLLIEQAANQIATVINSVSTSLNAVICAEVVDSDEDFGAVKTPAHGEDDEDEDRSFKSCKCSRRKCLQQPCHENCKKICENKYILGRVQCRSVSGGSTISLDVICDGKIDCEDESDEKDCNEGNAYARFEGVNMFSGLGQTVQAKIYSEFFTPVRAELFALQTSLNQLQKLNSKHELNKKALKATRNRIVELLDSIYVNMLSKVKTFTETENVFVFLKSLRDKLIVGLKRSHTGNERLVPSEDCSCRGSICNVPDCPPYCVKACSVEPSFTTLTCKGDAEKKVAISNICDGTNDCPSGDDEKMCDKEMCRRHHFMVLHMRLDKEIGTGNHQNLLGEILKAWKRKALTTVKTAEVAIVPNSENFKHIINKLLHDLVMAFTFTDDMKADARQLQNTFYDVSQKVIKLVDYCGTH